MGFHSPSTLVCPNLSKLFPPERPHIPEWNVVVVVRVPRCVDFPAFEPFLWESLEDRRWTTWKMVFLLALAFSFRCGQL